MNILFISSLGCILVFCFIAYYLMKRSFTSTYYFIMNASLFIYILSIYSVLYSNNFIYFRLIFASGSTCLLFVYLLLKNIIGEKNTLLDKGIILFIFGYAMCALTTPWVIDSIIYLGNSPLNKLNKVDVFKLYKLNYGWLHKSALLPACIVSFKSIYLTYNYIKKEKYILPVLYSAGAISLMLILTICSNILYPLISKNSNYSYLVVFWSLILCVGNFIAIAKYQFLDIRLIFSKSLIFLVCWQISFSVVFCLSMQTYLKKFNNTNEIRLTLVLLFFTLIYTISLSSFKSLLKNIIGNISNDINVIHTILTKELLNAKTLQHIFIAINKFVSFIEGSKWYGQLSNQQQQYISSDPSIPDQTYINHRKAINNTQDPITITTEKTKPF